MWRVWTSTRRLEPIWPRAWQMKVMAKGSAWKYGRAGGKLSISWILATKWGIVCSSFNGKALVWGSGRATRVWMSPSEMTLFKHVHTRKIDSKLELDLWTFNFDHYWKRIIPTYYLSATRTWFLQKHHAQFAIFLSTFFLGPMCRIQPYRPTASFGINVVGSCWAHPKTPRWLW